MTKEIAIGKRLNISQAQEYMLLAVLVAALIVGACGSITVYFVRLIGFNAEVIAEKEQAIKKYSDTIKNIGICSKPKGNTYSNDELNKCDPNNTSLASVPDTLRYNILEGLAANEYLESVSKESGTSCINPNTNKNWTYVELEKAYNEASSDEAKSLASNRLKTCSALRVVPDALPAIKNESALLSSLNQIFILSGLDPDSISPSGIGSENNDELKTIALNLAIEADAGVTMRVINNIERSIREFNIETATIEWGGTNSLSMKAQATAFYVDRSELIEINKTIKAEGGSKKK